MKPKKKTKNRLKSILRFIPLCVILPMLIIMQAVKPQIENLLVQEVNAKEVSAHEELIEKSEIKVENIPTEKEKDLEVNQNDRRIPIEHFDAKAFSIDEAPVKHLAVALLEESKGNEGELMLLSKEASNSSLIANSDSTLDASTENTSNSSEEVNSEASTGNNSDSSKEANSSKETEEEEEYTVPERKETTDPVSSYNSKNDKEVSDNDFDILCRIVEAEATDEKIIGKILVANVVLNRVNSKQFPNSIEEVVFQKNGDCYQFSPIRDQRYFTVPVTKSTKKAVKRALSGEDYSQGALYFFERARTTTKKAAWFDSLKFILKFGCHEFFK